jgi:hypothetical protein
MKKQANNLDAISQVLHILIKLLRKIELVAIPEYSLIDRDKILPSLI